MASATSRSATSAGINAQTAQSSRQESDIDQTLSPVMQSLQARLRYLDVRVVSRGRLRRLEERIVALEWLLWRVQQQLRQAQVGQAQAQAYEDEPAEAHADEGAAELVPDSPENTAEQEGAGQDIESPAEADYEPFPYLESTAPLRYMPY